MSGGNNHSLETPVGTAVVTCWCMQFWGSRERGSGRDFGIHSYFKGHWVSLKDLLSTAAGKYNRRLPSEMMLKPSMIILGTSHPRILMCFGKDGEITFFPFYKRDMYV